MAEQKKAGAIKVMGTDGQDITAKVGSIEIGNLSNAPGDLTGEDANALRGGTGSRAMSDHSSKSFTCTGYGCEDANTRHDPDW